MTKRELKAARERARFYAKHPKETAEIWRKHVLEILSDGWTITGLSIDSILSRKKHPRKYKPNI